MKLVRLRLSNFRSFSADCTELDLDDLTFFLGPNGAGKTAVLQALRGCSASILRNAR